MNRQVKLAAYLAYTRRAEGNWVSDWTVARLALREARLVLRKHLTNAALPHDLTVEAYAASEELRASAIATAEWELVQAQVLRVLPTAQRMLRTLAKDKKLDDKLS